MKRLFLLAALLLWALLLGGCSKQPVESSEDQVVDRSQNQKIRSAFESALSYVNSQYSEIAPPMNLSWQAQDITADEVIEGGTVRFSAESCVATVSYSDVAPEAMIYKVAIFDSVSGFQWQGHVDASGRISELVSPVPLLGDNFCQDKNSGQLMSYQEALEIVRDSDCLQEGTLKPGRFCNQATGTWWLDLDLYRKGCNPACVVDIESGTATINWRCTGLHPPGSEDQAQPEAAPGQESAEDDGSYDGWQSYHNSLLGYSVLYPPELLVSGINPAESVSFDGPLVDGEHWPMFTISHYASSFYRPPAGTSVEQWVLDSGLPYDALGDEIRIAGRPTLHLVSQAGPMSFGYDEFYFIHGEQLFRILILHSAGHQDWETYGKFLASFRFE